MNGVVGFTLRRVGGAWAAVCAWLVGALALGAFASSAAQPANTAANAALYAIAPRPGKPVMASYFGQHIHNLRLRGRIQDPPKPTPWPEGQVGALRLWDTATRWAEVQPTPDQWAFDRMDYYVDQATQRGVPVLYTLGSTPKWASARPDEPCSYGFGCAAEPADMDAWDRYVTQVARRYKGRIQHYEVWNEPHPDQRFKETGFYAGSMPVLVELTRRAREVLKREDPQALLLTPGFVNREKVLGEYLAAGGAQHVQGLSYHFYSSGDQQLLERMRLVQALRDRHNLQALPFFNTESGFEGFDGDAPPGYTQRSREAAAALNARAWVLGAFLGIERWYHHAWDNRYTGMVRYDGTPTPSLAAWNRVRLWLTGAQPLGCRWDGTGVVLCRLERAGRAAVLLWRPAATEPAPWAVPAGLDASSAEDALLGALASEAAPAGGQLVRVGSAPVVVWAATTASKQETPKP